MASRAATAMRKPAQAEPATDVNIPWQNRPLNTMQVGAAVAGVSIASLYSAAAAGKITLRRLSGRTLIETASLIAFIESAAVWSPSSKADAARAARSSRAAQARA